MEELDAIEVIRELRRDVDGLRGECGRLRAILRALWCDGWLDTYDKPETKDFYRSIRIELALDE